MGKIDVKSHPKKNEKKKNELLREAEEVLVLLVLVELVEVVLEVVLVEVVLLLVLVTSKKNHQLTSSDLFDGTKHCKNWEVGDVVWLILRQNLRMFHQDLDPKQGVFVLEMEMEIEVLPTKMVI